MSSHAATLDHAASNASTNALANASTNATGAAPHAPVRSPAVAPTSEAGSKDAELQLFASTLLGEIVMPAEARMHFPVPMFGLPQHREYALLPARRTGLWWLQSISDETLTFILADPFMLDGSYGIDLSDVEREMLQVTAADDAFTLVMITLPSEGETTATANFRAPIVFNLRAQRAMQVVARNESYSLRAPADISTFAPQADGLRMIG